MKKEWREKDRRKREVKGGGKEEGRKGERKGRRELKQAK